MEITKKVVLLGRYGVGKSSIARRYLLDIFEKDYLPTLGVQIKKKIIDLPNGTKLSMIIWDLEGFASVSKTRASYLLGSNAFIYVFDVSRPFTYGRLGEELNYMKTHFPSVEIKLVGNKIDLGDTQEASSHLKATGIQIEHFVSAKTGEGIQNLFQSLTKSLIS